MQKIKTTKKEMRENPYIIHMGYCDGYHLLKGIEPVAYSAGIYGWDCDYYYFSGVLISTGYRALSNKNVNCDYEKIATYNKLAKKIWSDYSKAYEERKNESIQLLHDFVNDCLGRKDSSKC